MAINIKHRPQFINPNNNLNTWVISSDFPNLIYVVVEVVEPVTNAILAKKKLFPRPLSNDIHFNLSDVLSNLCESVLNTNMELITVTNLPSYKLRFIEYSNVDGVITASTPIEDVNINYFFESQENIIDYVGYNANKYNINLEAKAKFLSDSKTIKNVYPNQKEFLKIFNTNSLAKKIKISYYDGDNELVETYYQQLPTNGNVININASPQMVINTLPINADTKVLVEQYTIALTDNNNVELTEKRLYRLVPDDCQKLTNIIYKNQFGGFSSLQFLNRIETITINKTYLNTSVNNGITYSTDSKYINNKSIIDTSVSTTYTATSQLLDDYDSQQIKQLLLANKVYVAVGNYYVEITVDNKTYKVLQRHVNGYKLNRLELQFTTPFSIEKLEEIVSVGDLNFNDNPNPYLFLSIMGDFVTDSDGNYLTLKY